MHVVLFPDPSVAVYVTTVVPIENWCPGLCVVDSVTVVQLSVAMGGVQLTLALHNALAVTVMSEGHAVITGAVLSSTITLNVHVETFPEASVAV